MNSIQESTAHSIISSRDLKARTTSQHGVIKITSLLRGFRRFSVIERFSYDLEK